MSVAAERYEARIRDLPEGSTRRRVLECARRFKSSWVDLGRALCEVKQGSLWREWGHANFEGYCARELFIKRATAEKLTMSYRFIERHEPELACGKGPRPVPAFEVIEVLSRAEAAGRLPAEGWSEVREDVLERAPTPAALSRQLSERYGPPPPPEPPPEALRLRRLAALARRLAGACAEERAVPKAAVERAHALAEALASLVES